MQFTMNVWTRDWESFNQKNVGRSEAKGLSDDEIIEQNRELALRY